MGLGGMSIPTTEGWRIANKVWDAIFGIEYDVESMSYQRKGQHYKVKHHGNGHWSCNCKSWLFKSGTYPIRLSNGQVIERTCKHIRLVMKKEGTEFKAIW